MAMIDAGRETRRALRPRPFLKWAGGKRQLLDALSSRVPTDFNRYFEPFVGGGALFFQLGPQHAVLGDMNEELLNAYTIVRDDACALIGLLLGFTNDSDAYYAIRRQDPSVMSPVERAARLIYLNKTCYNGLWRVNRSGQFNVPFGKYKNPTICDEANLMAVSSALQGTEIRCTDFEETLCDAAAGDFVYLDPPYDPLSATSSFTGYVEGGFGPEHQTRLARVFARLAHMGCHVLLSNSDTEFIRNLYAEFRIDMVEARRAINCRSDRRGPVSEVLISC